MSNEDVTAVGADGCRDGWVVAALSGLRITWTVLPSLAAISTEYQAARIAIDIPIGLPMAGRRVCDNEARDFLGRARSSIFYAPIQRHAVLARTTPTHPEGEGVSRQTWNIIPKINQVADDLAARPAISQRVTEVHPECSFRAMAGATKRDPHPAGASLDSKKSGRGVGQRLRLLAECTGYELPTFGTAPAGPAVDDLLDATAAAWTAERWRTQADALIRFGSPADGEILA